MLALVLLLLPWSKVHAYLITVEIDTTLIFGTNGLLVMDLLPGDSGLANSATITDFSTDGTLGGGFSSGTVSGSLADTLVLDNSDFFNSFEQELSFGNTISFLLDISENDSTGGLFPDRFSLFLFDFGFNSLVSTSDPTGADSLFGIDFTGTIGGLELFTAVSAPLVTWSAIPTTTDATPVPEPSPLVLMVLGLLAFWRVSRLYHATC